MRIYDAIRAARAGKETKPAEKGKAALPRPGVQDVPEEYPRPQLRRDHWLCLNGKWSYAFTRSASRPESFDGEILVPYSPECLSSGVGRQLQPGEYLWYCRTVELSAVRSGRLLLHFGAVDERCTVWWNGKCVGNHENGYLPFTFDVTEHLREGVNSLWVRVQDDTDRGTACRGKQSLHPAGMFYPGQSGIWQTVWMEWVPDNYIRALRITPLFDEQELELSVTMNMPERMTVLMRGEFSDYYHSVQKTAFSSQADGTFTVTTRIALAEFHPWSPEDPCLYGLVITAGAERVESYFAMRKFSVGKDERGIPRLFLNGEPYFMNGVLDQGYWPETLYTPPGDGAMLADIEGAKRLGFNMIRKHVKIEPLRWYYHCDRIGMLVWQDMVNGGGKIDMGLTCYLPNALPTSSDMVSDSHYTLFGRQDARARSQWVRDCLETLNLLYNCPCIALWVLFNEGWGQFDARKIEQRVRKEDPTRLIDHASGWFDQGGGDIASVHNYFRKLTVKRDVRPFVISEYGGGSCLIPGHARTQGSFGYHTYRDTQAFTRAFRRTQLDIRALKQQGLAGAVYTQLSDVEGEVNGLFTYDREVCKIT